MQKCNFSTKISISIHKEEYIEEYIDSLTTVCLVLTVCTAHPQWAANCQKWAHYSLTKVAKPSKFPVYSCQNKWNPCKCSRTHRWQMRDDPCPWYCCSSKDICRRWGRALHSAMHCLVVMMEFAAGTGSMNQMDSPACSMLSLLWLFSCRCTAAGRCKDGNHRGKRRRFAETGGKASAIGSVHWIGLGLEYPIRSATLCAR